MSCRRIAMWSGPRNISTTMMRSFENRPDTAVIDEPLYAHYLVTTGVLHPMQEEILASQPTDWQIVVRGLTEDTPAPIYFQKHMCHHLTPDVGRDWLTRVHNIFLIRDPARMVASYAAKMEEVSAAALGLDAEWALFQWLRDHSGCAPPVIDATDVLADPRGLLGRLCHRLGIPFAEEMLAWPAGTRASDGVWAPHWYHSVEASTGFRAPPEAPPELTPALQAIVAETMPAYQKLSAFRL